MAKNSANIRIGECDVWENAYSAPGSGINGGTLLGHTLGGIEFNFERKFTDLMVDQYSGPLDMALTGNDLKITVNYAEPVTEYLARAIPEGRYDVGSGTDSKLGLGRDTGFLLSTVAKQLVFHPRRNPANVQEEDIYIFKAVSVEAVKLEYKTDSQRVLAVTYRALVDETQPDGSRLGRIGNALIS